MKVKLNINGWKLEGEGLLKAQSVFDILKPSLIVVCENEKAYVRVRYQLQTAKTKLTLRTGGIEMEHESEAKIFANCEDNEAHVDVWMDADEAPNAMFEALDEIAQ